MDIGVPCGDGIEDKTNISRDHRKFPWVSPYGTRRECRGWVDGGVGCKPSVNVERVRELRDSGKGASAIAKELGIGRPRRQSFLSFLASISVTKIFIQMGYLFLS